MNTEVELNVLGIYESHTESGAYVMLLEEISEENSRKLPVVIGEAEALSIQTTINKVATGRPHTHDLMVSCFDFLQGELLKSVIYKVDTGVYYSYLYLKKEDEFTRIDARTSDAVALALKLKAPIYVNKEILVNESIEAIITEPPAVRTVETSEPANKERLEKELDLAIKEENYELASILRDRIAELE